MKKENIDKYLIKYQGLKQKYGNNPELASAFREILGYLNQSKMLRDTETAEQIRIQQELNGIKMIKQMIPHELNTPIANVKNFVNMFRVMGEDMSPEKKLEFYDMLYKEAEKMENIAGALYLDGCSRSELIKKPEFFSPEKMLLNYAHTVNSDLLNERVGLHIGCNRQYNNELEILANKSIFEILFGTLTGNSINYAPSETVINQGLRINKLGNLEIMIENKHDNNTQKRKFSGLGKGLGLKFTKEVIKNFDGNITIYEEPRIKDNYDVNYKFGYKKEGKEKGLSTLGVKITLPIKNLS